jgi:hypothetical protein
MKVSGFILNRINNVLTSEGFMNSMFLDSLLVVCESYIDTLKVLDTNCEFEDELVVLQRIKKVIESEIEYDF